MIIVYAAVAGQSVVKLYAAAMFPGFFLAFLYLIYVIGWAVLQPKVAPKLSPDKQRAPITPWVAHIAASYSPRMLPALLTAVVSPGRALRGAAEGVRISWWMLLRSLLNALVPLALAAATLGSVWWYVTIYSQKDNNAPAVQQQATQKSEAPAAAAATAAAPEASGTGLAEPPTDDAPKEPGSEGGLQEPPGGVEEPPGSEATPAPAPTEEGGLQQLGEAVEAQKTAAVPEAFYTGF
jgi:hypothetical protein